MKGEKFYLRFTGDNLELVKRFCLKNSVPFKEINAVALEGEVPDLSVALLCELIDEGDKQGIGVSLC